MSPESDWVYILDMRIKTKITASHTLNEKTNKQTNKQKENNNNNNTHHKNYMEIQELTEVIESSLSQFFQRQQTALSKGLMHFFSLYPYMHNYVYLRIEASFWFSLEVWLTGEKKAT